MVDVTATFERGLRAFRAWLPLLLLFGEFVLAFFHTPK